MGKKLVLALLMTTMLAGGIFAQTKAGIGLKGDSINIKVSSGGNSSTKDYQHIGFNAFLDLQFLELNLDLLFGKANMWWYKDVDTIDLVFGMVGKFPINLIKGLTIFPFVGVDLNGSLSAKYNGTPINWGSINDDLKSTDYMSRLSFLIGVGLDFDLTDFFFIRAEIGYGIIFPNKFDNDFMNTFFYGRSATLEQTKVPYKVCIGIKF